ncbi:neural cell adhesion molecule 2-like [Arapaima gigas]
MRREEEQITSQDDGIPGNEPNETTPLTEPEKLPLKEGNDQGSLQVDSVEVKGHSGKSAQTQEGCSRA